MILNCYPILKHIEPRPAMYLGENTLKAIHIYISGYYQALIDQDIAHTSHTDEPFYDWVADKLGYFESTAGWVNMIVAATLGFDPKNISWETVLETQLTKEQHALSIQRFYELLEEFKAEMDSFSG